MQRDDEESSQLQVLQTAWEISSTLLFILFQKFLDRRILKCGGTNFRPPPLSY